MGHFHLCYEKDTFLVIRSRPSPMRSLMMPEYDRGAKIPFCSQLFKTVKPVLSGH